MNKYIDECRRKIDGFFKPVIWWSLWGVSALYFFYMLVFKAVLFFTSNYSFLSGLAARDIYTGKIFFIIIYTPVVFFTCLLTSHLALGVHKAAKSKKLSLERI